MSPGIDVSSVQGAVDWPSVRGAGVGWVSPTVDSQFGGASGAGPYHHERPDTNAPEDDADSFAAQVNAYGAAAPGHLPPCLCR